MPRQTGKIRLDGIFADRKTVSERTVLIPGGWWLWGLLGLAVGLAAWIGGRQYLRSQLSAGLTAGKSEHVALQSIEALLRLDGDATVEVARGLAHPEFMVANASYRALSGQLDAWSRLGAAERLRRMQQLADELERTPLDLDQDHRILINGLASRIYAETISNREVGAAALLESCKQIMSREAATHGAIASVASQSLPSTLTSFDNQESVSPVPPPLQPLAPSAALVPGASSYGSSSSSASTSESPAGTERTSVDAIAMPRMTSGAGEQVALSTGRATVHLTATSSRDAVSVEPQTVVKLSDLPLSGDASESSNDATSNLRDDDSQENTSLEGIDDLPIDQLVRLLSSRQTRVTQAASLALRRKGMSDDKLTLAMQLANGTSAERRELLQSLVQRNDLDPRPWLLWMASEGDETVRGQAVGLLSPLLDNDVRRQLRMLLNKERDEQVAQTIRRVLVR